MSDLINQLYKKGPFSLPFNKDTIVKEGNDLLSLFDLNGKTEVIYAPVEEALKVERNFRFKWWIEKNDPLKQAMHNLGRQLDIVSEKDSSLKERLTLAWHQAGAYTNSEIWRESLQEKILLDHNAKAYYQLFFKFAQQSLNRAVRWEAIFSDIVTPYSHIYNLICYGILPAGYSNDTFYVISLLNNSKFFDFPIYDFKNIDFKHLKIEEKKTVFVSYEFNKSILLNEVINKLMELPVNIDLGPVPNNIVPIEHQLSDRIIKSSLLLVILESIDNDFGLPIWIFQEIDLAIFLKIPIMLIVKDSISFTISSDIIVLDGFEAERNNLSDQLLELLKL